MVGFKTVVLLLPLLLSIVTSETIIYSNEEVTFKPCTAQGPEARMDDFERRLQQLERLGDLSGSNTNGVPSGNLTFLLFASRI